MDVYTRVLVELHPRIAPGAQMARLRLQDVLIELKNAAAMEREDATRPPLGVIPR